MEFDGYHGASYELRREPTFLERAHDFFVTPEGYAVGMLLLFVCFAVSFAILTSH